jgi:hypothetical protein
MMLGIVTPVDGCSGSVADSCEPSGGACPRSSRLCNSLPWTIANVGELIRQRAVGSPTDIPSSPPGFVPEQNPGGPPTSASYLSCTHPRFRGPPEFVCSGLEVVRYALHTSLQCPYRLPLGGNAQWRRVPSRYLTSRGLLLSAPTGAPNFQGVVRQGLLFIASPLTVSRMCMLTRLWLLSRSLSPSSPFLLLLPR